MLEIADETWHSKNDGLKLIFVLDEQKAKSSFDTKEDETEDEMSQFLMARKNSYGSIPLNN